MTYDPVAMLAALTAHEVRFVLIGGVAGRVWGSPTTTNDIDVCYDRDPANLERLAGALRAMHARLRGVEEPVAFQLDAEALARGQNFTFVTELGPLDVLGMPAGIGGYADLAANAAAFDLGDGLRIDVCSLDDLIRMKEAAGRPKDRIELEVLAAVRAEHDADAR